MTPERWRRALSLFQAALAEDGTVLAARLDALAAGDEAMREALADLLRAHESAGDFLQMPAAVAVAATVTSGSFTAGDDSAALPFGGTARYTILQPLGEGGMGVVYEALDTVRQQVVALKTIRRAHPTDLLHFKREFRSLADVAHPNLVPLYDLVVEGETCFFTMERIYGVDLLQYLDDPSIATQRLDRLRHVFVQLAEALAALHRHGKLHRDIKPSNVLVTAEGRAIVLDFGLVADVIPEHGAGADRVAGTPAYLSPEDLGGARATVASDWYSVGITLYRALTGHLPFAGPLAQQRQRKLEIVPPAPADVASDVPSDLSAACMDLISRDVTRRLTGRDRLLSSSPRPVTLSSPSPRSTRRTCGVHSSAVTSPCGRFTSSSATAGTERP